MHQQHSQLETHGCGEAGGRMLPPCMHARMHECRRRSSGSNSSSSSVASLTPHQPFSVILPVMGCLWYLQGKNTNRENLTRPPKATHDQSFRCARNNDSRRCNSSRNKKAHTKNRRHQTPCTHARLTRTNSSSSIETPQYLCAMQPARFATWTFLS